MPWDFDNLQPQEFLDLWEGYQWRKEDQQNTIAYFVSNLMSVNAMKPVQMKDLLKPLRGNKGKKSKTDDE